MSGWPLQRAGDCARRGRDERSATSSEQPSQHGLNLPVNAWYNSRTLTRWEVSREMPTPFLSSEEYDERAHQLYNEGQFDDALDVLREGLALYPTAVELHIGVGYARLAREEFAWARRSFEEALVLDPDHEDGLAGLGETLLKFGQQEAAIRSFRRILELGYQDDLDLMLQAGRALFRSEERRVGQA